MGVQGERGGEEKGGERVSAIPQKTRRGEKQKAMIEKNKGTSESFGSLLELNVCLLCAVHMSHYPAVLLSEQVILRMKLNH